MGKCCQNCFNDRDIKAIINTSSEIGKCDYCGQLDTNIVEASELEDQFQLLIEVYAPITSSSPGKLLFERINSDWNGKIFNIGDPILTSNLLKDICPNTLKSNPTLFNSPVEFNPALKTKADEQEKIWEKFGEEIKHQNRFFITNTVNLDLLERQFKRLVKQYKVGSVFFRARISEKSGFDKSLLGKPPVDKARGGRANPPGVSYLYLSNDETTTLYEVRAALFDYITIGEFRLKEDINVISLRGIENFSPFELDDLSDFLIHRSYLSRLEKELSKPLRRSDSELDYLPSQYLCERIKYLKYDGVEYGSSLNMLGYNLAIFDDSKLECVNSKVFEVTSIEFAYSLIT